MKISHLLAGSALGTATLAGIAMAQVAASNWPQVELADLEQCRPVIAQVHKLEVNHVRQIAVEQCNAPARYYSTESCRTARRWLSKTESQDDLVWYFEGNDRCQGTDYPCYGVKIYNTARSGDEARRWAKYFMDKSGKAFSVTRGMDLWTAAREADTCVSGVWATKYREASAPPPPVQLAEVEPPPPPPLPQAAAPVEVAQPADAPAEATTAAVTATTTATATAAAATTATATTAALMTDKAAATATTAIAAADTPAPAAITPPAPAAAAARKSAAAKTSDPMAAITTLIAAGKTTEAIALADELAAKQPKGEGSLTACKTRVLARQDLDKALVSCYSTGKPNDPAVLETRGQLHLLAGRPQEAWNDFNTALNASNSNSALYLRGLAAAGMGNTADALKDMAKAEAGEEGIMAAYEAKGYTLAAVMSGKPLVEDAAPAVAPVAAAAVAAAAPVAVAPAVVPAAPVAVPEVAVSPPVEPPPAPVPTPAPAAPVAPPAAAPAPAADGVIPVSNQGNFAAATGAAVAVPGISLPAVTDCLVPVAPGSGGKGAFKNKCNYPVRFTYCNIKGADNVPQLTCGSDTKFRAETIGGNGSAAATLGLSVAYFACRSPTLPEVIYTTNNGLEGYCR